jgi:pimeloyl-ACP methyl ester carboxylesterase
MGGSIAAKLAATRPDLISAAVIMDSSVFHQPEPDLQYFKRYLKLLLDLVRSDLPYSEAKSVIEEEVKSKMISYAFTSNLVNREGKAA